MLIAHPLTYTTSPSPSPSPPRSLSKDDWKTRFSLAGAKTIGHGSSGVVFAIDEQRVIKVFSLEEEGVLDLERERAIYDKLQIDGKSSSYVVKFEEQWGSGLIMERLTGTLRQHLRKLGPFTTPFYARRWIREFCKGLAFLHENDILHGDIGCQNILLDTDDHIKLCDFAGSKLGDEEAWISYEVRSQHPHFVGKQPTAQTEIFALGSVIYEIWTCRPPYASEPDLVVQQKFLERDFPLSSLNDATIHEVVGKCWLGDYTSVAEVCMDIE